ncbi:MAG: hypothetical protein U9R26_03625 [Campylobacterota bacterium]|nr:hypothetical protein [Campylobacterota bacterium]
MGRSRYKIYEPTHPHFVTCTILHWLPIFTKKESVKISKIKYIHNNPVKRGYVEEAAHWRYSSATNYNGNDGLIEIERFW